MQWKHFGPNEAMWALEDTIKEAYPFLFQSRDCTKVGAIPRGWECNTPFFTLDEYWIRLCINCKCIIIMTDVKPGECCKYVLYGFIVRSSRPRPE